MNSIKPLEYGKVYHLFNRGVNKMEIFRTKSNYEYFLHQYNKYIDPVADTFAWCLMKNHFHLLIRVKTLDEIFLNLSGKYEPDRLQKLKPSRQFSHFFNSYAKAFNKQEKRSGALFERPFQRRLVENESYYRSLVIYIHQNPVHHKLVDSPNDYPWSSFPAFLSLKPTNLARERVLSWFDSINSFKVIHKRKFQQKDLMEYLMEL
jgi:REP element-mobilizing transposase RayT